MLNFIGRDLEINELNETMRSNRSEFVVIYGRRRVGKTCLVHHFFNKQYAFHYVGSRGRKKKAQLADFAKNLQRFTITFFIATANPDNQQLIGIIEALYNNLPNKIKATANAENKVKIFNIININYNIHEDLRNNGWLGEFTISLDIK